MKWNIIKWFKQRRKPDDYTQRGFGAYARFKDQYGNIVRVQESSNVYGGIWIFCNPDPDDPRCTDPDPSPHLTLDDARTVIKALQTAIRHQEKSDRIWDIKKKPEHDKQAIEIIKELEKDGKLC